MTCDQQSITVPSIVMLKSLYKVCLNFDVNTISSVFQHVLVIHSLISEKHNSINARPSNNYWNDPLSYTTVFHLHNNGETIHAVQMMSLTGLVYTQ